MSRFFKSVAAAVLFAACAPAALAERPVVTHTKVSYADLDLSSRAGAQTLLRRIDRATSKVCGKRPGVVPLKMMTRWTACRDAAVSNAIANVNSPTLTLALNNAR